MLSLQRGVTLIELVIAIAVFAIITLLAVPSFISFLDSQKSQAAINDIKSTLQRAVVEAKNRQKPVYICASGNGTSCLGSDWRSRYIVCIDNNADQTCDAVLKTGNATSLNAISASSATIRFNPNGTNTSVTLTLCSKYHENSGKLNLSSFGSVSSVGVSAAECPSS